MQLTRLISSTCFIPATVSFGTVGNSFTPVSVGEKTKKRSESFTHGGKWRCQLFKLNEFSEMVYSLLLSRSKQNTKESCVFYMSNALTCSGKVHVKCMDMDSTRFMAMAAEIMLFFPPKAL